VPALLSFSAERGFIIRFIELMRTGVTRAFADREFVSAQTVQAWLGSRTSCSTAAVVGGSPSRDTSVVWDGAMVRVGWISPLSHPFCTSCNRLRIDSHGVLRRCLMDPMGYPLLRRLDEVEEGEVSRELLTYLAAKVVPRHMVTGTTMMAVGG
jgi:cyclic pyranopterin phosphate synthase